MGLLVVSIILLTTLWSYFKWKQTYWKRRGINGPESVPFVGSFYKLMDVDNPRNFTIKEWTKKYGKVFGFYEGPRPILVTSDVNMLQELFITKFDNFYARKNNMIHGDLENPEEEPLVNLFTSRGARWKRLRTLASPHFSVKALKNIFPIVEDSVLNMMHHLEKVSDVGSCNIHLYFQEFTFDVISRIAMGQIHSEQFNNENCEVAKNIFMRTFTSLPWFLANLFPTANYRLKKIFFNHPHVRGGDIGKLVKFCENAVDERIAQRKSLIEQGEEPVSEDFIDIFLQYHAEYVPHQTYGEPVERKLTTTEVVAQCFVFLLAGFDTTANSLAYVSYLLAKNPHELKKIQAEIDEICTEQNISYEIVNKLTYLDAVTKEALRHYPLAAFASSRICVEPTTLGEYKIEKGTIVEADVLTVHFDKELWGDDAEEFRPARWLENNQRHVMSWFPFGAGPRQCVGMRLAFLEEKLALAHILRKYDIVAVPETEKKLTILGCQTLSPEKVTVGIKKRDLF